MNFDRSLDLPVPRDDLFDWHARPGAFERLSPTWQRLEVIERSGGIEDGGRLHFVRRIGPFRLHWVAEHRGFVRGERFEDVAVRRLGRWRHLHEFTELAPDRTRLDDRIEYSVPLIGRLVRRMLVRMFRQRHVRTANDLRRHLGEGRLAPQRIALTGASGLVGRELTSFLTTGGHSVIPLVRRAAGPDAIAWDPAARTIDAERLEGFDAVVSLAGETVGQRWTPAAKRRVFDSRVDGTRLLCEALAARARKPKVLVCASALGFYGDSGDRWVDENSPRGAGFLADVCEAWEAATEPARAAGIRVVNLRLGVIITPRGGALSAMLLPASLGLGGPIGTGSQYLGWIDLDDLLGAVLHAIRCESLSGPVDAVAPEPVTQREFAKTLGRVLHRPAILRVPAFAIRAVFGEMGREALLASQRARPTRLLDSGFRFDFPRVEDSLRHQLGCCDDDAVAQALAAYDR